MAVVLPTVSELKTHLNIDDATHDVELNDMLDAAVELVEQYVGPLEVQTVTDEVHHGGQSIVLKRYPVVAITAAEYWDGTAITVADLEVDPATGIVEWGYNTAGYFTSGRRNVRITYTTGRDSLPAPIKLALVELVRDMWSGTQSGGGAGQFGQDVETAGFTSGRPALPPYVYGLLEPYMLGPTVG